MSSPRSHCKPLKEAEIEFASNTWFCKTNIPRGRMTAKMRAVLQAAYVAALADRPAVSGP